MRRDGIVDRRVMSCLFWKQGAHRGNVIMRLQLRWLVLCIGVSLLTGCQQWPALGYRPVIYNPFPQLHQVAVLPFFNQSNEPTVDGFVVAEIYQSELQKIPGFKVMPVGVVEQYLLDNQLSLDSSTDFQELAQDLGVDVLVVGSITVYSPYNPPRLGLAIDWYAANASFHRIPAGYGLPWGSEEEEFIPDNLVWQAEFELAREQMKTQEPIVNQTAELPADSEMKVGFPKDWPDPKGFIPSPPLANRPPYRPYHGPLIEQVRLYDGSDRELISKLQAYYNWQQDTRTGGWRSYLERSEDFTRFCCYVHLTEMLAARGGVGQSELVFDTGDSR